MQRNTLGHLSQPEITIDRLVPVSRPITRKTAMLQCFLKMIQCLRKRVVICIRTSWQPNRCKRRFKVSQWVWSSHPKSEEEQRTTELLSLETKALLLVQWRWQEASICLQLIKVRRKASIDHQLDSSKRSIVRNLLNRWHLSISRPWWKTQSLWSVLTKRKRPN